MKLPIMANNLIRNDFDVFVAGQIGSFRGIGLNVEDKSEKVVIKNLQNLKVLTKDQEVTALEWGDPKEIDVLIGLASQRVKIYDTEFKTFTSSINVSCGQGKICGLSRYDQKILTAVQSGHVQICSYKSSDESVLHAGPDLEKMKHSKIDSHVIATGGKENDLKLWNLEKMECTYAAKNVKPNMLQLRVPIWISDMTFLPESSKVALVTRHGHVRLYDPSTPQRRPVISMEVPEQSFCSIAATSNDHNVVVGSGTGTMMLIDLRKKGQVVQHYKGFTGGIRAIACCKTLPYIVSVSLDRHLRVHHLHSKALLHKIYLKSRLNCLLLRSDAFMLKQINKTSQDDSIEIIDDDDDDLFKSMEIIEEPSPKKRKLNSKKS